MNANQYKQIIARLNLSQVAAARLLDISDTTSRRWIAGTHRIPCAADMLLRAMIRYRLTPDDVLKLVGRTAKDLEP